MSSTEQIISEIIQIKNQYEAQVTGEHKQWPLAIKERINAVAKSGLKLKVIAEKTGISYHTISSWIHGSYPKPAFREIAIVETKKLLPPKKSAAVTVKKKPSSVTVTKKTVTVTVLMPSGCRIEGLPIDELAEFFKKLGAV